MSDMGRLRRRAALAASVFACWAVDAVAVGAASPAPAPIEVRAVVHGDRPGPVIDRHVYGQFAEHLGFGIYGGVWVGANASIPNTRGYRNDVVAALRELEVPVVRWPGGCFADEYDWREGVGARDKRPVRVNTHWGGVEEPNSFGTHEFMDFAELIGADADVNGDLGSGTPREMAQWVEYITNDTRSALAQERRANGRDKPWRLPFFTVGNETWGCGGNMRPAYAADLYRRYETFVKSPSTQHVAKFASGAHDDDYAFTEGMMSIAGDRMEGLTFHYYTIPTGDWSKKGPAVGFGEDQWISTLSRALFIDELITRHGAIMDRYDPARRVAMVVDEWGVWTDPTPGTNPGFLQQQNSLRDALVAAVTLDVFHKHADRVRMANIAQMVNVLQAMILTDGPRMVLTPTYHVFEMYKPFQGATSIPVDLQAPPYAYAGFQVPSVHATAGRDTAGRVHVALVNLDPHRSADVRATLAGIAGGRVTGRVLTGAAIDAVNTFAHPDAVRPAPFRDARLEAGVVSALLPPKSVVVLDLN